MRGLIIAAAGLAAWGWGAPVLAQVQAPVQGQEAPQVGVGVPQSEPSKAQPGADPEALRKQELPLWEFGLGLGGIGFRDYRGSDTTHAYPVPIAYFLYRGKYLQTDRSGLKTKLPIGDRLELNLSLNATTPVRNNATRDGMPDLRTTVEIGPALEVHLWRSSSERMTLDVRLPIRAAFALGSPGFIGWFSNPNINLDVADAAGVHGLHLGLLSGPLFAASRYDAYYYSVASQYATPERAAYEATGGYAGSQVLMALSKRYPKFWAGAYVRYDTLAGASFEDSPLVKSRSYWSAGIGIAWMINHSARMVEVPESESP